MVQAFWDANFKVKTLSPQLKDNATSPIPSPVTVASSATQVLQVDESILLRVMPDPANADNKVKIELGVNAVGTTFVAETGTISANTDNGVLDIPLEGITHVRITNEEAADRDIQFVLFTA